jgi:hypothetical protein
MAVAPERRCRTCPRRLPPQAGPGRRRQYCNATCRSAARRGPRPTGVCGLNIAGVHCGHPAEGEVLTGRSSYRTCGQCRYIAEDLLRPVAPPEGLVWRPLAAAPAPHADAGGADGDRNAGGRCRPGRRLANPQQPPAAGGGRLGVSIGDAG